THVKKTLERRHLKSNNIEDLIDKVIDPTIIAVVIRNIYETVCLFHLIFINTKDKQERDLEPV
ncbi:MAG: hypothetical protein MI923_27180, partial [Phycisphaerales bacterium]|nr:hypothetical protein [Phycisphaerales bacterium]